MRFHPSLRLVLALGLGSCSRTPATTSTAPARPLVDHHQHLFGPALRALNAAAPLRPASDLVAQLDSVGIRRAVILSVAYMYANPNRPPVEGELDKVRAENDWTAAQVAAYPDRLRGFCSVNPLRDYALSEIARCAASAQLRTGLKLHFGNSDVQLDLPAHVEQLRQVFGAANANRMAIVVHMRPSVTKQRPYGAAFARAFIDRLLPGAPDVPVQIAHLGGAGGYDAATDSAIAVFADAIAKHDPRMRNVYFDVSGGVATDTLQSALVVRRIRELGLDRILYGSDAAGTISAEYASFHTLPLNAAEFRRIESNVAPYMR